MTHGIPLILVLAMLCAGCAASKVTTPKPHNRAEAVKIIADMRHITAPNGIERLEKVRIGGIDQWISIRGTDRRNPVMLVLHGGPGYALMPMSWYFQRGWEEYFTVVQWDQRGSGKTYTANDPKVIEPTMTVDRMVADAEEMIAWLRKEFSKDKIFVLGHSWGSMLGLMVAERRGEWLHAYIGMGQGTNLPESERRGWQWAMERARAENNEVAIRELQSISPYAQGKDRIPLEHVYLQRKWINHYGGSVSGATGSHAEEQATLLSPEYSDREIQQLWEANDFSEGLLLDDVLTMELSTIKELKCPLIVFAGRYDYNVSSTVAEEWFQVVKAPVKHFIWFENTAHEVMNEAPGRTLVSLVTYALPLAKKAGDGAQ